MKKREEQLGELEEVKKKLTKVNENLEEYFRQRIENELVAKELELLSEDAAVFKQVGPCLIKQDMFEAKRNVSKRVEYISKEIGRLEGQKRGLDQQHSALVHAINKAQQEMERARQAGGEKAAA